jgi:hypothetical protein
MWCNSFKKFLGLLTNLQHDILEQIFTPIANISDRALARIQDRIQYKFGDAKLDHSVDEEEEK